MNESDSFNTNPTSLNPSASLKEVSFSSVPNQPLASDKNGGTAPSFGQDFVSSWGQEGKKVEAVPPLVPPTSVPPVEKTAVPAEESIPPEVALDMIIPESSPAPSPSGGAPAEPPAKEIPPSFFDGKPSQVFGNLLFGFFALLLTLGIALPWVYCRQIRWDCNHMVYEGKRLHFDGRGSQLVGKWILWYFLSLLTIGIYAWFLPIKFQQWKVQHCHFE